MTANSSESSVRAKRLSWLAIGVFLLVLGTGILLVTHHLRGLLVPKIVAQDGLAFGTAILMSRGLEEELPEDLASDPDFLFARIEKMVLDQVAKRSEVVAVRIFDANGSLQLKIGGSNNDLLPGQVEWLQQGKTISRFKRDAKLSEVADDATDRVEPLVYSIVPLHEKGKLVAAAELILDGREVALAIDNLDRDLWLYGGLILVLGGAIASGALRWAFGKLEHANKLLAERTQSLLRANHELTLSSKTAAIGAITAHLIHDLKNPLFGLQSFVSARGSTEEEDWDIAQNTTERMQKVIGEIVRILQEEKTTEKYEVSIGEVLALLRDKLHAQCSGAGISFLTQGITAGSLMNRDANMVLLVITNIVQNAIQATPRGGQITVTAAAGDGCVLFSIRDTGPGLPEHIRANLFTPSRSTKPNGTGLGLAISKQLANHIGAELLLKETSPAGTVFELRIPEKVLLSELV